MKTFKNPLYHFLRYMGITACVSVMLFTIISCEKEGEAFPDEVIFRLSVEDDLGTAISGAKVSFYDNEAQYQNAVNNNDITGAVDTLITTGGLDSVSLEAGIDHWVLVQYFDNTRMVLLSNVGVSSKIDKLPKSTELFTKFFISPQTGNVSFYTLPGNHLPIRISLGPLSDTLFSTIPVAPTAPGNPNASNFMLPNGLFPYFAVSDNGCVWTGQVAVTKGGFHPIQLSPCVRGRVTFLAPGYTGLHGPINVSLDNNDFIGTINSSGTYTCASVNSSASGSGTGNYISVTRDLNNYTYIANSQDNACVWTGSFSIQSDTCIVINLPTCP